DLYALSLVKINLASIITLHDLDCPSVKYLFVYELYVTNLSRIISSITAQQTKLDLELVPKEKILKIRKCNGRLNPGKKQREPTFQVVLDALALTPCYSAFLITADGSKSYMRQSLWEKYLYNSRNVTNVELLWRRFSLTSHKHRSQKKQDKKALHTSRDDYLINTLRFVSTKEEYQIYGSRLPKSMTSPEMQETKAYKTYLVYATGVTPPKKAQKFKKATSPKLSTVPASLEEPTRNKLREVTLSKKDKEQLTVEKQMTVEKRKGIDLLSEVALTKEAQYEEVHKNSLRDFYKTRPSGSGTITKIAQSAVKIKHSITNEGTGAKPGVPNVTEEESTESEAESWGRDEDDSNNNHDSRSEGSEQERDSGDDNTKSDSEKGSDSEHETDENESGFEFDQEENEEEIEDDEEEEEDEFVKISSNDTDDEDETKIKDKTKG
ncbi:hypothetical protein Tco_1206120, partial [Tanacetum coccineum]